jgi:hypothetical protein
MPCSYMQSIFLHLPQISSLWFKCGWYGACHNTIWRPSAKL